MYLQQKTKEHSLELLQCLSKNSFHLTLLCFDLQTVVPGNRNNAMLQSLHPDTPYNITVEAIYAEGPGGSLNGNGRTGEETIDDPDELSAGDKCWLTSWLVRVTTCFNSLKEDAEVWGFWDQSLNNTDVLRCAWEDLSHHNGAKSLNPVASVTVISLVEKCQQQLQSYHPVRFY